MAIKIPKKTIVDRLASTFKVFIAFAVALFLAVKQIISASSSSALDSMGGTDSSAVDYPLESFRQIQNTSISISIPSQLKSQVETGYSNSSLHCQSMQDWFEKPHWRNLDLDQAYVDVLIGSNPLSTIDEVLRQTICHEEGKFRQTVVGHWNASNSVLLSEWEFKLIYLAIHDFHHRPAREEHKVRSRCSNKIQLPSYDYQCKDAKFLVTSLPGIGMGASVRLSATTDVTAAIANDRIPLFLDNAASGPAFLKTPAQLFSCNRRDPQCIFLPTSPCTLLLSDLDESVLLTEPEGRRVRRSGSFPDHLAHHRILIMTPKVLAGPFESNARFMNSFREKVQARALGLIDEWYASLGGIQEPETTAKLLFLKSAALRITQQEARVSKEGVYQYLRQDNRIAHAIGLYLLRPNPTTTATLHEELHGILPASMNPETTVGLPIRGSDKCRAESTCLPFDRYMQLARETWEEKISRNNTQGKRGSLIMTTEDKILFEKRLLYTKESGFPLDFVVNDKDPLQGSGLAKVYGESADRIMISSLLAIQMQLRAGSIYGNCCSNFHLMLFDFAKEGCGLTEKATCLQETKNYKVCCGWRNDEGCDAIRKEHHEEISRTAAEKAALLTSSVAISNLASEGF